MSTLSGGSEIVESTELNPRSKINGLIQKYRMLKPGQVCSVGDDINKLFEAMDKQVPSTSLGLSDQVSKTSFRKRAMKRPMTSCSKIGFSDSVSLKQAFRGLSISQASEMAAIKRLSKQVNFSRTSNSVCIGNKNLVEISLIPEESTSKFAEQKNLFRHTNLVNKNGVVLPKVDEIPRCREKVEFSQSSNCSISSTSTSNESTITWHRPHTSNDGRWEVVRCFQKNNGCLGLEHFKLLKKIGGGDIGNVYLAELMGTGCLFALKIMDKELLVGKKKVCRAETEREILQMLDHPFLPTLFAYFTTERFSVLVMEYFPGGDLDVLRKKKPKKRFSEQASRFYIAEVLLALEYLHMLGIVYRDLKPENVLLREDGHIILSDFDLSLKCSVRPKVLEMSLALESPKTEKSYISESKCIHSLCFWQVPCFTQKLLSPKSHNKHKAGMAEKVIIAEPTNARSNSFVGTHEYLAPEIIRGEGHGSAVDWWTLGIFVYELVYGKTPFKGPTNEDTNSNIVSHNIKFPDIPDISPNTKDLIVGLLAEDPENRLGYVRGASEIKQHPFFEGINWALIRCTVAPELPSGNAVKSYLSVQNKGMKCRERFKSTREHPQFEMS